MTNFIEIEHIPRWLENSNLSKVFKENDNNSALLIPENKYKKNINILNVNDFYRYIEIYRYWMMDDCPFEIYDYFLKNYSIIDLEFLKNEFNDTIIIKELIMCYNTSKKRKWLKMRRQFSRKMQFRCILSCKFNRNWDSQVFDRQNPAPFKKFR